MPSTIKTPGGLQLLDARDYPNLARRVGIRQTAVALILTGRLVRLDIGRRSYYRLDDLGIPEITDERPDLAGLQHTITIERVDPKTANAYWHDGPPKVGDLAIVERHDGRIAKVCRTEGQFNEWLGVTPEQSARAYAKGYGATYVPAVAR